VPKEIVIRVSLWELDSLKWKPAYQRTCHPERSEIVRGANDLAKSKEPYLQHASRWL